MTDEELKELVAGNSRQIRELHALQAEDARILKEQARDQRTSLAETEQILQRQSEALRDELRELARSQKRTDKHLGHRLGEVSDELQELTRSQKRTDKQLGHRLGEVSDELQELARSQKRTDKQLGELGNRLGGFTEGMALPSVREFLFQRFGVDAVVTDARARRNGHALQIDAVGITNGEVNEAYLVEIKSRLREESLQQILRHLSRFGDFFPDHRGKTLYGILVAVDVPEELEKRVARQGIYLAKIHGGLFELAVPDDFQPRGFTC